MKLKKFAMATALASAAALVLAGCAGETGGGGSEGGGDASDPIRIMTIAPVDTTIQNYPDARIGAQAAVDAINAAGGINGRQLEWTFCNQKSDPNEASACAREAERDNVVAIVGQTDAFSTSSLPLLEQAGIPSLGIHSVGNEIDWESASSYPFHGGAFAAHSATINAMKQRGVENVQIIAIDVAASTSQIALIEQAIEREGLNIAGMMTIPVSGVTDYAPYAQQIADNNADGAVFMTSAAVATAVIRASHALNINPIFGYNAFSFGETELQELGTDAEGVVVASPYPSYRDTHIPAIAQFNEELDAAGAGDDPSLRRLVGFNAWFSVHAFAEIAKTMDGDITAETFKEKLDTMGPIDLLGVMTWDPANLGNASEAFPRLPLTPMHFLGLNANNELALIEDLEPIANPLAGLTR